jgi:hypothetical protein
MQGSASDAHLSDDKRHVHQIPVLKWIMCCTYIFQNTEINFSALRYSSCTANEEKAIMKKFRTRIENLIAIFLKGLGCQKISE